MKPGFVSYTYGRNIRYAVFVPRDYDGARPFPLILFLHGAGETGTDGVRQTQVGLGPHLASRDGFLGLFPQSQRGGWRAGTAEGDRAIEILDQVHADYKVDGARIHLTGISMGGYGAWSLAAAYPERWASLVPICGGGDPEDAARMRHIPCWCFHGVEDDIIPVAASRAMIDALRAAGAEPRYTELPGVAHNSWDAAYSTPELYEWWAGLKPRAG